MLDGNSVQLHLGVPNVTTAKSISSRNNVPIIIISSGNLTDVFHLKEVLENCALKLITILVTNPTTVS